MTGTGEVFRAIGQFSSEYLVECFAVGTLIALGAALMIRLLPRQNSGTRFALWFSVLVGIAVLPALVGSGTLSAENAAASAVRAYLELPASWAMFTFLAWAGVAGVLLFRVAVALRQVGSLRAASRPIDAADLPDSIRQVLQQSCSRRNVTICRSDRVSVPVAVGLFKPAVLLPDWLLQEMTGAELHHVVVHELAHLRRWDDWTNLAQKVLRALLFFHPAVWWIEQRVSLEREMACDDLVVASTGDAHSYAECLAKLTERSLVRRTLALAQAAVSRIHDTSLRVMQLLDVRHSHATRISKPAFSLLATALVIGGVVLARQPELVSFNGGTPGAHSAAFAPDAAFIAHPAPVSGPNHSGADSVPRQILAKATMESPRAASRTPSGMARRRRAVPRLVSARAQAPSNALCPETKAVFLVIETRSSSLQDSPMWQVRVWRVTVIQPANLIPQKQT